MTPNSTDQSDSSYVCMWSHDLQPIIFQCSTSSHDSFSLSTSNYRALASHIHHITPSHAHRLLQVASHSGHAPSVGGAFSGHTSSVGGARRRPLQLRSSPTVIFNAIMGSHTSYEVILKGLPRLLWGNENFSNLSMPAKLLSAICNPKHWLPGLRWIENSLVA